MAYRLLTDGTDNTVAAAVDAYRDYYDTPDDDNRKGDEFVRPSVVVGSDGKPLPRITDGDAVIFYNFRGDRPRELTKAFCLDEFPFQAEGKDGVTRQMGFKRIANLTLNLSQ